MQHGPISLLGLTILLMCHARFVNASTVSSSLGSDGTWMNIVRVNCGVDEPEYDDDGLLWASDSAMFANVPATAQSSSRANELRRIYRSNRASQSPFAYTVTLDRTKTYRLTLHHVELSLKAKKASDANVFSIVVNNQSVINWNLIEQLGDTRVAALSQIVVHDQDRLTLDIVPTKNNGLLAAFEVDQLADNSSTPPEPSFKLPMAYPPRPAWIPIYRINSGGDDYVSSTDFGWSKDVHGQRGSQVISLPTSATNALPDPQLYLTGLESTSAKKDMRYRLSLPARTRLNVTATFVETDPSLNQTGARVCNIKLEGQVAEAGLDIVANTGFAQLLRRSYTAMSRNKKADIGFERVQFLPKVSTLQVAVDSRRAQRPPVVGDQLYFAVPAESVVSWPVFFFDANPDDVLQVSISRLAGVSLSNGILEVDGEQLRTAGRVVVTVSDGKASRTKQYYFQPVAASSEQQWVQHSMAELTGPVLAVQSSRPVLINMRTGSSAAASPVTQGIETQAMPIQFEESIAGATAAALDDDIFVFGGATDGRAVHKLVSANRLSKWTLQTNVSRLPWSAEGACAVSIGGFAYICGGSHEGNTVSFCGKM